MKIGDIMSITFSSFRSDAMVSGNNDVCPYTDINSTGCDYYCYPTSMTFPGGNTVCYMSLSGAIDWDDLESTYGGSFKSIPLPGSRPLLYAMGYVCVHGTNNIYAISTSLPSTANGHLTCCTSGTEYYCIRIPTVDGHNEVTYNLIAWYI